MGVLSASATLAARRGRLRATGAPSTRRLAARMSMRSGDIQEAPARRFGGPMPRRPRRHGLRRRSPTPGPAAPDGRGAGPPRPGWPAGRGRSLHPWGLRSVTCARGGRSPAVAIRSASSGLRGASTGVGPGSPAFSRPMAPCPILRADRPDPSASATPGPLRRAVRPAARFAPGASRSAGDRSLRHPRGVMHRFRFRIVSGVGDSPDPRASNALFSWRNGTFT